MKLRTLFLAIIVFLSAHSTTLCTPEEKAKYTDTAKNKASLIAITEISAPIFFQEKVDTDEKPFVIKSKDEIHCKTIISDN